MSDKPAIRDIPTPLLKSYLKLCELGGVSVSASFGGRRTPEIECTPAMAATIRAELKRRKDGAA